MKRHLPRALGCAAALLLVAGCTSTVSDPPAPPIEHAEERLTQVSQRSDGFTALLVTREEATAIARTDGGLMQWHLTATPSEGNAYRQRYPSVDFAAAPPSTVAAEAKALAAECAEDDYLVRVEAVTPGALLGTVRCGAGVDPAGPFDEAPDAIRFNGAPLPSFDDPWQADTWQRLLDLSVTANGSGMLENIRIEEDGRILISMGNTAISNDCRPALLLVGDGSDAIWSCHQRLPAVPGTLDGWAGATLSAAVDAVAATAGARLGQGTEVILQPEGTALRISVRQGGSSASDVVTP